MFVYYISRAYNNNNLLFFSWNRTSPGILEPNYYFSYFYYSCQRNYCQVKPGRKLEPTTLGIVLVHGYLKIDPDLVHPQMRSAVEEQLDLVATGKANFKSVLKHTLDVFKLKFQYFVKNIEGMDQLFECSFSSLADSGRPFSRCGKYIHFSEVYTIIDIIRRHTVCTKIICIFKNGKKSIFAQEKTLTLPKMQFSDFFLVQKLMFCHFRKCI